MFKDNYYELGLIISCWKTYITKQNALDLIWIWTCNLTNLERVFYHRSEKNESQETPYYPLYPLNTVISYVSNGV